MARRPAAGTLSWRNHRMLPRLALRVTALRQPFPTSNFCFDRTLTAGYAIATVWSHGTYERTPYALAPWQTRHLAPGRRSAGGLGGGGWHRRHARAPVANDDSCLCRQ